MTPINDFVFDYVEHAAKDDMLNDAIVNRGQEKIYLLLDTTGLS